MTTEQLKFAKVLTTLKKKNSKTINKDFQQVSTIFNSWSIKWIKYSWYKEELRVPEHLQMYEQKFKRSCNGSNLLVISTFNL